MAECDDRARRRSKRRIKAVAFPRETGGYGPLTELTGDPTYGSIPAPVAEVCALTYLCLHTDVHPAAEGHRVIASAAAGR